MPRDSAGVYTLPPGNPVVSGTVIASPWANTTMSDIAAQLNNVLTRDGLLGPVGPFLVVDGTVNAPGLAWAQEPGLGWYRKATGQFSLASAGAETISVVATDPLVTSLASYTRAAGNSNGLSLFHDPAGSANVDYAGLQATPTAVNFGSFTLGTGTKKPIRYFGTDHTFDARVGIAPSAVSPILFLNSPGISNLSTNIVMNRAAGTGTNSLQGQISGVAAWQLDLGNPTNNFTVSRFNGSGVFQDSPFIIAPTGVATFNQVVSANISGNAATASRAVGQDRTDTWGYIGGDPGRPYMRVDSSATIRTFIWQTSNDNTIQSIKSQNGMSPPGYLEAGGTSGAAGITWNVSDMRLKKYVKPSEVDASGFVRRLKFYDYDMEGYHVRLGFSAQDLEKESEEMVFSVLQPENTPHFDLGAIKNLNIGVIVANLAKALQETINRLDTYEPDLH